MTTVTLKGNKINTNGTLPANGTKAPNFTLVSTDLKEMNLESFGNKRKVLNIFPSIDTPTCATSVRNFNKNASEMNNTVVINISADLPFAQKRFCGAEGITNVEVLSSFRSDFANTYGLEFTDGPLKGLCSRAVIVLDENNQIIHTEQVAEIADEPNYEGVLTALK